MTGWIIYNGTLNVPKIIELVDTLVKDARELNINLEAIKNTELIPMYNNNGEAKLIHIRKVEEPKFIIFWDKDVLLASHLEKMGYRVFNSSNAIKNCDHKGLMHLVLSNNNIEMPKTIISPMIFDYSLNSEDYLISCYEALGESVIIKEAMGSFGMQVYLINNREEFINKIKELNRNKIDFIIQENIKSSFGKDIRVNIIGDKVIGAMLRTSETDFRPAVFCGSAG